VSGRSARRARSSRAALADVRHRPFKVAAGDL
jgi:hypothetical protein